MMNVKDLIKNIQNKEKKSQKLSNDIEELRFMLVDISAPTADSIITSRTNNVHDISADIQKLEEKEAALQALNDEIIQKKTELYTLIRDRVPDPEVRALLLYRYIHGLPIEEIAEIMDISPRNAYTIQKNALQLLSSE